MGDHNVFLYTGLRIAGSQIRVHSRITGVGISDFLMDIDSGDTLFFKTWLIFIESHFLQVPDFPLEVLHEALWIVHGLGMEIYCQGETDQDVYFHAI